MLDNQSCMSRSKPLNLAALFLSKLSVSTGASDVFLIPRSQCFILIFCLFSIYFSSSASRKRTYLKRQLLKTGHSGIWESV